MLSPRSACACEKAVALFGDSSSSSFRGPKLAACLGIMKRAISGELAAKQPSVRIAQRYEAHGANRWESGWSDTTPHLRPPDFLTLRASRDCWADTPPGRLNGKVCVLDVTVPSLMVQGTAAIDADAQRLVSNAKSSCRLCLVLIVVGAQ